MEVKVYGLTYLKQGYEHPWGCKEQTAIKQLHI